MLSALLLGAGAGLVSAFPHPQRWGGHKHHHSGFPKYTFSGPDMPTSFPSLPSGSAASGILPSGYIGTTGTGAVASSCAVQYVTVSGSNMASYSASTSLPAVSSDVVSPVTASNVSSVAAYSATGSVSVALPSAAAPISVYAAVNSSVIASASPVASAAADSGCTFTDADAAASGKASCSNIILSGITVPAGKTLDMTDLTDGTTVQFQGTTTFEYDEWEGPLISCSGKRITITGADGHVIDGNGGKWWDGEGSNGGVTKPKFFYAHDLTESTISGLNIKNTPVQGFSVHGAENLKIQDVTIDNTAGDGEDGGHNTDCFDVGSSTGVYLSGITCKNQDDCMAINSDTDIHFSGGTCSGGHGLSIGSVGGRDDNDVKNIYIADSTISNSDNGVRIKCNSGTTGSVSNVT